MTVNYRTGAIVTTAIVAAFVALSSVCISIEFLGHTPTAVAIGLLAASLPVTYITWRVRLDVGEVSYPILNVLGFLSRDSNFSV